MISFFSSVSIKCTSAVSSQPYVMIRYFCCCEPHVATHLMMMTALGELPAFCFCSTTGVACLVGCKGNLLHFLLRWCFVKKLSHSVIKFLCWELH